jgi:uncharacterized protein YwqG
MPAEAKLIRELRKHALTKRGAQDKSDGPSRLKVAVPGTGWGCFFDVHSETAILPIATDTLKSRIQAHRSLKEAPMAPRDGHSYVEAPLDGGIPAELLMTLIDDAYLIVWNKLNERARRQIELSEGPYDEKKLIATLIADRGLTPQAAEIKKLVKPALLLRTKASPDAKISPGASKIGGEPDLPAKTPWPTYRDGKPQAFLAQLNLAEMSAAGTPLKGLPTKGLLSLFSVWGRLVEGDYDSQTPQDGTASMQEVSGWSVILHTLPRAKLERRKTPRGVNKFKSASVTPTPIFTLPNHRDEPEAAKLKWSAKAWETFDRMQCDFRSLQNTHFFNSSDDFYSRNQLGGYAVFQQCFPEEVLKKKLKMLLQIGSDDNTNMMWGDGGELTFYVDAAALAKGRFERVWGESQGG